MYLLPFFLSLVASFGFGGWPLVAHAYGIPPLATALIISIGTLASVATVGPAMFTWDAVARKAIYVFLGWGVLNGISILAYSKLISNDQWNISTYVPLVISMTLIISVAGGAIFFKECLSVYKALILVIIIICVYLLPRVP